MNRDRPKLPTTTTRRRRAPVRVKLAGIQGNRATFAPAGTTADAWRRQLKAALGTGSDAFVDMCLHQLQFAARMPGEGASETAMNGALAMITAAAPTNEIEAALAVQMACTHMVAMAIMARIGGAGGFSRFLPALASASAKLLRAYSAHVETLRRLRQGGEQNIRVEHVHVHQGGQAIVGAVVSNDCGRIA